MYAAVPSTVGGGGNRQFEGSETTVTTKEKASTRGATQAEATGKAAFGRAAISRIYCNTDSIGRQQSTLEAEHGS